MTNKIQLLFLNKFTSAFPNTTESFIDFFRFFQKNIITPMEDGKKYWEQRANKLHKDFFTKRDIRPTSNIELFDATKKSDQEYVLMRAKQNIDDLNKADKALRSNPEFMLKIVYINRFGLQFADASLKKDRDFMLEAAKISIDVLVYADESLTKDPEFILQAAKIHPKAVSFADYSLKRNDAFSMRVIEELQITSFEKWQTVFRAYTKQDFFNMHRNNPLTIKYALEHFTFRFSSYEIKVFEVIGEQLKNDRELMLLAARCDVRLLQHLGKTLKEDKKFIREAARHVIGALLYADEKLKSDESFVNEIFEEKGITHFADKIMTLGMNVGYKNLMYPLVACKNHALIKEALQLGFDPAAADSEGVRALDLAILNKDKETLQLFINHFQSSKMCYGYLQLAARTGWEEGVKMLWPLFNYPNLVGGNLCLKQPTTLLHDAIYSGNTSLVEFLLQQGFDIHQMTHEEKKYSHTSEETVQDGPIIRTYESSVYIYHSMKITPLGIALLRHPHNEALKGLLIQKGAKYQTSNIKDMQILQTMFERPYASQKTHPCLSLK